MIVKLNDKNQLTLPERIVEQFPDTNYFSVKVEFGRIILQPVNPEQLGQVHEKLEQLRVAEDDIHEAVEWSRTRG